MGTFHPKEALFHMEEGWMLVEEGLFHPEEPLFLLWMAMMLPKEGTFLSSEGSVLPGEGLFLPKDGPVLIEEGMFHPDQPSFLLWIGTMLLYERLFLPEEGAIHSVHRRDAALGVRGVTLLCRKPPLYRRPSPAAGDGRSPESVQPNDVFKGSAEHWVKVLSGAPTCHFHLAPGTSNTCECHCT